LDAALLLACCCCAEAAPLLAGVEALLRGLPSLRRLALVRCGRCGVPALRALGAQFPACAVVSESDV
jgi:hypothetical protein